MSPESMQAGFLPRGFKFPHCGRRKWLHIEMLHLFLDNPVIKQNCLSNTGGQKEVESGVLNLRFRGQVI